MQKAARLSGAHKRKERSFLCTGVFLFVFAQKEGMERLGSTIWKAADLSPKCSLRWGRVERNGALCRIRGCNLQIVELGVYIISINELHVYCERRASPYEQSGRRLDNEIAAELVS